MKFKYLFASLLAASLLLAGCGDSSGGKAAGSTPVSMEAIQAEATGFNVGSAMSARTVYVFFDAQCPHCGELWYAAKPLRSQAKFIWIPVGILNAASTSQGATLLASSAPAADMEAHEASLMSRNGGISARSDIEAQKAAVGKNTALFNAFGFGAIPSIVGKHAQSGELVRHEGALSTQALASLLGLQAPPP